LCQYFYSRKAGELQINPNLCYFSNEKANIDQSVGSKISKGYCLCDTRHRFLIYVAKHYSLSGETNWFMSVLCISLVSIHTSWLMQLDPCQWAG
jgi:hypothetical protein